MCVDNDSRPPIRPIAGGSAGSRDLTLTSSDGTRFMAHTARASKPTGAGMVVIPDVRGLHPYYKELADRFAEVGVDAVAIDFFARTAPSDDRGESFDFMSHVPQTKPDLLQADIAAAVAISAWRRSGLVCGTWDMKSKLSPRSSDGAVRAKKSIATASTPTSAKRSASSL